jgi:hypothetical protein
MLFGTEQRLSVGQFSKNQRVVRPTAGRCAIPFIAVAVWLAAIQPQERQDYAKVMSEVVKPGGRILLDVLHMDKSSQRPGPPYRFS